MRHHGDMHASRWDGLKSWVWDGVSGLEAGARSPFGNQHDG